MPLDLTQLRYLVVSEYIGTYGGTQQQIEDREFRSSHDRSKLVEDIVDGAIHWRILHVLAFNADGTRDVTRDIAGEVATEMARRLAKAPDEADISDIAGAFVRDNGWTPPCKVEAA